MLYHFLMLSSLDTLKAIIQIFPKQVKDTLTIVNNNNWTGKATIYNTIGKPVKTFAIQKITILDLSNLPKGQYILYIQQAASNQLIKQKFIKCGLSKNGRIVCNYYKNTCVSCTTKKAFLSTSRIPKR